MGKVSPLQRSLKLLRDSGWTVGITEHFNPHVKIRQDYCGFADCIAFRKDFPILAVNAMHMKHRDDHEKLRENEKLYKWIEAGHRFALYQWHSVGRRWHCFVKEWNLDDMRIKRGESSGEPCKSMGDGTASGTEDPAGSARPRDGGSDSKQRGRTDARSAGSRRTTTRRGNGQAHKLGDANNQ